MAICTAMALTPGLFSVGLAHLFDSLLTSCPLKVDGWSLLFLSVHVLTVHVHIVYAVYVMSMAQLLD